MRHVARMNGIGLFCLFRRYSRQTALYVCKRALDLRGLHSAVYIHKRALYIRKSTLSIYKRALYSLKSVKLFCGCTGLCLSRTHAHTYTHTHINTHTHTHTHVDTRCKYGSAGKTLIHLASWWGHLDLIQVCCSVLQCVAVWCSVVQCVAVRYTSLLGGDTLI